MNVAIKGDLFKQQHTGVGPSPLAYSPLYTRHTFSYHTHKHKYMYNVSSGRQGPLTSYFFNFECHIEVMNTDEEATDPELTDEMETTKEILTGELA